MYNGVLMFVSKKKIFFAKSLAFSFCSESKMYLRNIEVLLFIKPLRYKNTEHIYITYYITYNIFI